MNEIIVLSPASILAESTSSGFGGSYWGYFLDCAAKLKFKRQNPGLVQVQLNQYTGAKKLNMTTVGVFFHKLRELWRIGRLDGKSTLPGPNNEQPSILIEWGGQMEIPEWQEACRLFQFYMSLASRTEWDTVSVEEGFEFGCRNCARFETQSLCTNPGRVVEFDRGRNIILCELARKCIDEWGVPCISGRWDEVAFVTEEQLSHLQNGHRQLPLLTPGHYVVDAKCKGVRYETVQLQHETSKQFTLYELAWTKLRPDEPCQGVIVDGVYAYKKEPVLESFFVLSDEHKKKVLKNHLSRCWRSYLEFGLSVNTERCFDYGKTCIYLERGFCNRLDD